MNQPVSNSAGQGFAPVRFGVFLALLIFAAFPQVILGLESFVARDFGFFAYPLAHFQRDCFWRGELPFWNPYNDCGIPFLAQWNTMPLYPPALLYLTLPLHWSLSFFSLAHLWWAGLGMYFLARRWTGNDFAAAFAGTVFAFNGFTLNLLMWPSHIATFSWLPWVILAAEPAWREGGRKIFIAAIIGALQMLAGGPETIFLTWIIASVLWLQQLFAAGSSRAKMIWRFPVVVIFVIALSAAQLFPFLDLVAHAQRATGYTDLRWSMPLSGLANFFVPMAFGSTATEGIFFQHGQYWTSSYYLGLGTLWLALLAAIFVRDRRVWLLTGIIFTGLLCALGESTPFYPLVRKIIPQLSFITYPIKFVMVVVFAAPLLAAISLADFEKLRGKIFAIGGILVAVIFLVVFFESAETKKDFNAHLAVVNGFSRAVFLILTGAVFWWWKNPKLQNSKFGLRALGVGLLLIAWLDVFTHEPTQNPTVAPNVFEPNLVRTKLALNPSPALGESRAMLSPQAALDMTTFAVSDPKDNFLAKRVGLCANANLLDGIPKVDGFFSLTPREFDNLLSLIYSATNGNWSRLEDFMGVAQTTSPTNFLAWSPRETLLPLVTAGSKPVFVDDTNALWAFGNNVDTSQIVFLPPEEKSFVTVSNQTEAKILDSKFGNNTVTIEAEVKEPAMVVIAQTFYHNWQATVDGQPTKLLRANVAFQAVQISSGKHEIHLVYKDHAFEIGALISGVGWFFCLSAIFILRRKEIS
jgi:Bacterial membrane protein YfhO